MKAFLTSVIALFSGLIGASLATDLVFPRLMDARFPSASTEGFLRASSECQHYSFVFFAVSAFAGALMFMPFLTKSKSKVLVGILAALASGAVAGSVSCMVYFYSNYSFSN